MEKLVFQSVFFPEAAVKLRIPVFRISRKRMTDAREMAADLMALSGHQLNLQQRTASSGTCLLYTSPSPRDYAASRMPSSA